MKVETISNIPKKLLNVISGFSIKKTKLMRNPPHHPICLELFDRDYFIENKKPDLNVAEHAYAWHYDSEYEEIQQEIMNFLKLKMENSGGMFYPANGGFMGWHTNEGKLGTRVYLSWTNKPNQGTGLMYYDENDKIQFSEDTYPFLIRIFSIDNKNVSNWHCVKDGQSDRISLGFKCK